MTDGGKTYLNTAASSASVAVEVPAEKRKVAYVFNTSATKSNLGIPYAVSVAGAVLSEFEKAPGRVPRTDKKKKIFQEKIEVEVDAGSEVALYLNSDAHPSYRQNAVYAVTPDKHDVEVTITEKKGKHSDADTPTLASSDEKKKLDAYTAPLTGDIWMKVTHKYTASEAAGLMPDGTSAEVTAAVKSIYEGLAEKKLSITVPATDTRAEAKLDVVFEDADNPKSNIVTFDQLKDGLPRVHPAGYAAIFSAAIDAGVPSLHMSSAWRPSLGSIAHRAGLGVDVSYVGATRMNRQELRGGVDTTNVSAEEKRLFDEYEAAMAEEATAKKASDAAKKVLDKAKKAADAAQKAAKKASDAYAKVKDDPAKAPAAKAASDEAAKASEEANKARDEAEKAWNEAEEPRKAATEKREEAEKAWNEERDRNEPEDVRELREHLAASPAVSQLFDPWFMDANTRDKIAATPNLQVSANETLHAHHLHVTVREPKIL